MNTFKIKKETANKNKKIKMQHYWASPPSYIALRAYTTHGR
jgi:hypothetical protein